MLAVAGEHAERAAKRIESSFTDGMSERERVSAETTIDLERDENNCPACLEPFSGLPERCPSCGLRLR